jgi:hypothetical protein
MFSVKVIRTVNELIVALCARQRDKTKSTQHMGFFVARHERRAGTGESEEGIVVKEKMYMEISPHTMKGTSPHPPGLWSKQPWLLSTNTGDGGCEEGEGYKMGENKKDRRVDGAAASSNGYPKL